MSCACGYPQEIPRIFYSCKLFRLDYHWHSSHTGTGFRCLVLNICLVPNNNVFTILLLDSRKRKLRMTTKKPHILAKHHSSPTRFSFTQILFENKRGNCKNDRMIMWRKNYEVQSKCYIISLCRKVNSPSYCFRVYCYLSMFVFHTESKMCPL